MKSIREGEGGWIHLLLLAGLGQKGAKIYLFLKLLKQPDKSFKVPFFYPFICLAGLGQRRMDASFPNSYCNMFS